ncbi:MAG: HlyC/CorC family transporter [Verrucomicrobia bacterium]|nr:HlyC/CorC family transporter [Verrucomicrobiota bacterium]
MSLATLFLALLFLLGAAVLAAMTTALMQMGRIASKEEFKKHRKLFFFQYLLRPLFGKATWEGLFFTLSFSKHVLHLAYAALAIFFLLVRGPFKHAFKVIETSGYTLDTFWVVIIGLTIVLLSLIAELLLKLLAMATPALTFRLFAPIASVFLTLFSPVTALFFKLVHALFPKRGTETEKPSTLRDKILEVLYESDLPQLETDERKLILSVASFKERIAREVMVPRIDVLCLPEETTIQEAASIFIKEGYSRIPIYEENIDHIVGVLLYKDLLSAYVHNGHAKHETIKNLIKPVLYSPETKKISKLLQEFRAKQIHIAIVVDEYGGTEGIVTIEDILEELVGEIADEYDVEPESLYSVLPAGGWIVDGRMTILDIEKELGILIPHSPEYDTLGGYIFHTAGAIPTKGWRLHHDEFDLEILSSDDRSIEKVRIMPLEKES